MNADRYARHRAIAGFSQDALAAARVIVVGAGAIGNEVIKNLALLGVGRIDVIDLDHVEVHNLTRSVLFRPEDIGRPKAECVAGRARELDPSVRIEAIVGDVRDVLPVGDIRDADIVIGALDNFEARIRLNQLCWLAGTPWVNTAIDSRHATVETFPFDAAERCACYECGLPASVYRRIAERQSCGGLQRAALAERVMPTTIITAALAAARATEAALRFAMGKAPSAGTAEPGRRTADVPAPAQGPVRAQAERWLIDSRSGHASVARLAPLPHCPGCTDLPRQARLVRVPDAIDDVLTAARAAVARQPGRDTGLRLADPMIWSIACRRCGDTPATRAAGLRPARRVTDRVMRCERCDDDAVAIEIRDLVDLDDLEARLRIDRGPGPRLDQRQIIIGDTCLELTPTARSPTDG